MDSIALKDMLSTEEGQLNAVYAMFGSVAQKAQYFERALVEFLRAHTSLTSEQVELPDLDSEKRTMGTLLRDFKGKAEVADEGIVEMMAAALHNRNFVMHRYFPARSEKLGTKEGRMELLDELAHLDNHFELASVVTRAMNSAMAEGAKGLGKGEKIIFNFSQVKKPGRKFPASWLSQD